jgi:tau tubulin kinase
MGDGLKEDEAKKPDILAPDDMIKEKWKIVKKIAAGGFGQVYLASEIHTSTQVAIKTELSSAEKQLIKMEVAVFKTLPSYQYTPTFLYCGRTSSYNFLVMSLVGDSLGELRKQQKKQRFAITTVCYICIHALHAIKFVHDCGVLHRDVKPSNFAIGLEPNQRNIYLIDFGLARFFRSSNGEHLAARRTAGFRGTSRYASLNAHHQKELSRRDDLWSLFYMSVELAKGELPWRKIKEKKDIERSKLDHPVEVLTRDLPDVFRAFGKIIESLGYDDDPDYPALIALFTRALSDASGHRAFLLDWERPPTGSNTTSAVSSRDRASHAQPAATPSPLPDARLSASRSPDPAPNPTLVVPCPCARSHCSFACQRHRCHPATAHLQPPREHSDRWHTPLQPHSSKRLPHTSLPQATSLLPTQSRVPSTIPFPLQTRPTPLCALLHLLTCFLI